jgi:hypothetical protein
VLVNAASLASEGKRLGSGLDEAGDPLVVQRQVLRELALLLPGEDLIEILVVSYRTVRVVGAPGLAGESGGHCEHVRTVPTAAILFAKLTRFRAA